MRFGQLGITDFSLGLLDTYGDHAHIVLTLNGEDTADCFRVHDLFALTDAIRARMAENEFAKKDALRNKAWDALGRAAFAHDRARVAALTAAINADDFTNLDL